MTGMRERGGSQEREKKREDRERDDHQLMKGMREKRITITRNREERRTTREMITRRRHSVRCAPKLEPLEKPHDHKRGGLSNAQGAGLGSSRHDAGGEGGRERHLCDDAFKILQY